MAEFNIITVDDICAVVATSYVNPVDNIENVENKLAELGFTGEIYFDMLLCNGLSNRYTTMLFDGKEFDLMSDKTVDDIPLKLKEEIYKFYMGNFELFELGVVPKVHQFLLKEGVIM